MESAARNQEGRPRSNGAEEEKKESELLKLMSKQRAGSTLQRPPHTRYRSYPRGETSNREKTRRSRIRILSGPGVGHVVSREAMAFSFRVHVPPKIHSFRGRRDTPGKDA